VIRFWRHLDEEVMRIPSIVGVVFRSCCIRKHTIVKSFINCPPKNRSSRDIVFMAIENIIARLGFSSTAVTGTTIEQHNLNIHTGMLIRNTAVACWCAPTVGQFYLHGSRTYEALDSRLPCRRPASTGSGCILLYQWNVHTPALLPR
jgi:hypothetical protein